VLLTPKFKENTCAQRKSNFWRGPQISQGKTHLMRREIRIGLLSQLLVGFGLGVPLEMSGEWFPTTPLPQTLVPPQRVVLFKDCVGLSGGIRMALGEN